MVNIYSKHSRPRFGTDLSSDFAEIPRTERRSRDKLLQFQKIVSDFISWRNVVQCSDKVCISMIKTYMSLYERLLALYPELASWKPEIINAFEQRPLQATLPIFMVSTMIVMLYVAYVYVYMPVVGVSTLHNWVFHSCLGTACWAYYMGLITDPGAIPDSGWADVPKGIELMEKKKSNGEYRYCNKERKYKPDRTHFCSPMQRNVLRMDHYCPWLSNCIGYRNHKYFFLFLLYTTVASNMVSCGLFSLISSHAHPLNAGYQLMIAEGQGLSVLLSGVLTPFFAFHCWLLSRNMTTIEFCEKKTMKTDSQNQNQSYNSPYDINIYHNLKQILGPNPLLWLFPVDGGLGEGLHFEVRSDLPIVQRQKTQQKLLEQPEIDNPNKLSLLSNIISASATSIGNANQMQEMVESREESPENADFDPDNNPEETIVEPPRTILSKDPGGAKAEMWEDFVSGCEWVNENVFILCDRFNSLFSRSVETAGTQLLSPRHLTSNSWNLA